MLEYTIEFIMNLNMLQSIGFGLLVSYVFINLFNQKNTNLMDMSFFGIDNLLEFIGMAILGFNTTFLIIFNGFNNDKFILEIIYIIFIILIITHNSNEPVRNRFMLIITNINIFVYSLILYYFQKKHLELVSSPVDSDSLDFILY